MFRRWGLAFGLAVLCLDVSAKTKPQPPLPIPLAEQLPVEVVLDQLELAVDVPLRNGYRGDGLLGSLIVAGLHNREVKAAEEQMGPLRDVLVGYRFNERMEAALRAKLVSQGLSPQPTVTILSTLPDYVVAKATDGTTTPPRLLLVPHYAFDQDFAQLSVTLATAWVERIDAGKGKTKTVYHFTRTYAFRFPLQDSESELEYAERWALMGSERLAGLLDQGIAQVTDMLVYDFSAAGRAEWDRSTKKQWATLKDEEYDGIGVRQADDWVWVRNGIGVEQTLEGYHLPVSEDAAADVSAGAAGQ